MKKNIGAIVAIFILVSLAWAILGQTIEIRTRTQDSSLKAAVGQLWGSIQTQKAPRVYYKAVNRVKNEVFKDGNMVTEYKENFYDVDLPIEQSRIKVDLDLDYRKKGLLWYSTYGVDFEGRYKIVNSTNETRTMFVDFEFPNAGAVYDNFLMMIGDREIKNININEGKVSTFFKLAPNESQTVYYSYHSQGLDEWGYNFGDNVRQVKDFSLVMNTDFKQIDFPQNTMSPSSKTETGQGWKLTWDYSNLLTGVRIGMSMPAKLNPGPWVAKISFFAPISLFLFLFMLIIFSIVKQVDIHPMNYFFICAAYFSFHLLLAYLVDHISIHLAFIICSVVSIFLVISYIRFVVGNRFAFIEVGLSQFVFLVLFSYTFFFEGFTGLTVTVLCILTLFIAMQMTAKIDWYQVFAKGEEKQVLPYGENK